MDQNFDLQINQFESGIGAAMDTLRQYAASSARGWFDSAQSLALESIAADAIFAGLSLFIIFEWCYPFMRQTAKAAIRSYYHNASIFLFNSLTVSLLSITSLYVVAEQFANDGLMENQPVSIFSWFLWLLVIDFSMYLWHVANHRVSWLWMFHKVHHSDPFMNVSTALRFHVGELVLTVVFKCALIVLFGISEQVVIATQALMTGFTLFHHSNIAFNGEKRLSQIIVVPYLHRMHHSSKRSEHDHNYGSIFSFWDRLFGTLKEGVPVEIGLRAITEQNVWESFKFGFMGHQPVEPIKPNRSPEIVNQPGDQKVLFNPAISANDQPTVTAPWLPSHVFGFYMSYLQFNVALTKSTLELVQYSAESFSAAAQGANRCCSKAGNS